MRIMINFSVPSHLKIKNTAFEIRWASFYLTKLSLDQPLGQVLKVGIACLRSKAPSIVNFSRTINHKPYPFPRLKFKNLLIRLIFRLAWTPETVLYGFGFSGQLIFPTGLISETIQGIILLIVRLIFKYTFYIHVKNILCTFN